MELTTPKVLTDSVLETIIKNAENKIYREIDTDQNVFYATSNANYRKQICNYSSRFKSN